METGYNRETVDKLLQRFIEYGKILYDAKTKELYIINWLRYNSITNPNVEKCVLRELKAVKSKRFVQMFLQKCLEEEMNIPLLVAHFGMPVETPEEELEEEPESCEAEKEIDSSTNVFAFYEQNFGSLSPYTAEELTAWVDDLSEELVLKALQIAHENNKRTLAYVKGILRDWHGKGYTKVCEVVEAAARFRKKESSIVRETEQFLVECEEWEKNVPSEEDLQKFLAEKGWRP